MLAYIFWHRPREGVDPAEYEEAQRAFHRALKTRSACYRLAELPFTRGERGYEDWYLVKNWETLGHLNRAAVDSVRRADHDRAASWAADGWGAVYALARGPISIPDGARWLSKPRNTRSDQFLASIPEPTVWQRQMVLGPGPEFCVAGSESAGRKKIWPSES